MSKLSKADEAAVAAGRKYLARWLLAAYKHGGIVYDIPKVARSGMSRQIVLARIVPAETSKRKSRPPGPAYIERLWPTPLPDGPFGAGGQFSAALDAIAKDWGFSFKTRNFVVGGCGMDMVFALVDHLATKAGLTKEEFGGRLLRGELSIGPTRATG